MLKYILIPDKSIFIEFENKFDNIVILQENKISNNYLR